MASAYSTLNLRARTGEWLWPLYVSISRTDPFLQPFHPGDQIGLRRLDHPIKMIRHEDIGVNLLARLGANLAQCGKEALAIRIIHGDQFAPVTAIHDVINRASLLDSQLAGHDGGLWPLYILISGTDPFSAPFSDPFFAS